MRKLLLAVAFGLLIGATTGCLIPPYSGEPTRRVQELIFTSESLRLMLDDWERGVWMLDQPDHCTPYRVHGGII